MNRDDITKYISEHKTEFEQEFGVKKIGIFGSYARDEAHKESDIDIVVVLEKPDLFLLIGIKQVIEEAFNKKVDVVRMRDNMNSFLRQRIERDVVYV